MNKIKMQLHHRYLITFGLGLSIDEVRVIEISKGGRYKLAFKDSLDDERIEWIDPEDINELLEDLGIAVELINKRKSKSCKKVM